MFPATHAAWRPPGHSWTSVIDGIEVVFTSKRVRYLRLGVSTDGSVRASVPLGVPKYAAEAFARTRMDWVRAARNKMASKYQAPAPLANGAVIKLWGDDVTVRVVAGRAGGRLTPDGFTISVPDPTDDQALTAAVAALYRRETKAMLGDLFDKWQDALGCRARRVTVRAMTTRWGSCTPTTGAIRINPELAARHPRCLNYVVLHELAHLRQPGHGPGFQALMDAHLPNWRAVRAELNKRPASHPSS